MSTPRPLRIVLCGGRRWHKAKVIEAVLDLWLERAPDGLVLVHCAQAGAQSIAAAWALAKRAENADMGLVEVAMKRGESAYNHALRVFDIGKPDVVFAFPGDEADAIVGVATVNHVKVMRFEWKTRLRQTPTGER